MNLSDISDEQLSDAQEDLGTYEQMETNLIPSGYDNTDDIELCNLAAEHSNFVDKINYASGSVRVAQEMLLSLESIDPKVGMSASNARVIMTCVEGMRVSLGHERGSKRSMSAESIGSELDNQTYLRMAKEGIISFIGDVIKAIFKAIVDAGKWIYDFFARLFNRDSSTGGKIESLKKSVEDLDKRSDKVDPRTKEQARNVIDKIEEISKSGGNTSQKTAEVVKVATKDAVAAVEAATGRALDDIEKIQVEKVVTKDLGVQYDTSTTHSVKIFKKTPTYSAVPNLQMNGRGYKDVSELLKWVTEFEKYQINHYEKAVQKSNLDNIIEGVKGYLENIDNDYARQDKIMKVLELTFKPIEMELQGAKVENDIKCAEGPETIGGYAIVGLCPDLMLGGGRVEKHLGGSHLTVKKVQQDTLTDGDKSVPPIELDFAKKILVGVEGLQKRMMVSHLMPFKKIQDELTHSAQELQKKFEDDESLAHLGHLAITAVHAFNATYINYVATTQAYATKIINELLLVTATAANKERVALQMAEGLDELVKKFSE